MESLSVKKPTYPLPTRIIAAILTVALLLSMVANAAIRIRIEPGERTQAATNYLVDNTDYVGEGRLNRLQEKIRTLSEPENFADYYRLAGTQIAEENYEGALDSIKACIQLDSGADEMLTQDILMKKGCLEVLLEQYPQALESLDQVLLLTPDHADAYLVKAQIYAEQERIKPLSQALASYMELIPDDSQIRLLLAQTYFSLEDFEKAGEQYERLLKTPEVLEDPAQIHYLYALTNIQLGSFEQAEENLQKVRELKPATEGLAYYLGVCQMAREDYAKAAVSFTDSIEAGSMVQLSRYSRGVCGLVIQDYDLELAVEDLQTAAEYAEEDQDPTISQQAKDLLMQLTLATEETQP